ncbi:MAG: tetratricopeptide repeat protein, partial [Verrucomicrobiota bacterium]
FALGLMCKPMLVTLPLVLLLLDYWPLGRVTRLRSVTAWRAGNEKAGIQPIGAAERSENDSTPWRDGAKQRRLTQLLLEKLPLFGLAAVSCVATFFAQTGATQSFEALSLPLRLGNALISCVAYLGQMFWPSDLAVLYPFTAGGVEVSRVALSLAVLAGISTGVFVLRRRRPCLLTGWLWYLVMLVPVIGIIQVGFQARADRYTYLPQIGLYLLLTWAAADLCAGRRYRRAVLGGCAAIILLALICCAHVQATYWRNSESLWTHTVACAPDNWVAHNNLGLVQLQKGDVIEAISQFQKALEFKPDYALAHYNLGNALLQKGNVDEAMVQYQKALQIRPDYALAHNNLGNALLQKGNVDEAMVQYQKALQINPGFALAHYNLGNALCQKGNVDEAIPHFQKALEINPDDALAHYNLGNALLKRGSVDEAMVHYQKALQIRPDHVQTLNNLAWVLATCPQASLRNGNQAVALAQRANQLTGDGDPAVLGTLAAAYAEAGRFPEAVATAQRALQLAATQSDTARVDAIRSRLRLYQAGRPFHDAEQTP